MRRVPPTTAALLLVAATPRIAEAQTEPTPTLDFFEYLGSWQDEDEEWFVDAEIDGPVKEDTPDAPRKREGDEDDE
jgi:hypothetical protein